MERLIPILLLALAIVLVYAHLHGHRAVGQQELDRLERDFRRRQFRRRMQASIMLAVLAITLLSATWIDHAASPSLFVYCWFAVIVLTVWIGLLAAADLWATRLYASRARHQHRVAGERLHAELSAAARRNGERSTDASSG